MADNVVNIEETAILAGFPDSSNLYQFFVNDENETAPSDRLKRAPLDILDDRFLVAVNNLSDLDSAPTARTNLGLVIGTDVQAALPAVDETAIVYKTGTEANTLTLNVDAYTEARVVTMPDASFTPAGLEVAQTFTAVQTFTGGLKSYTNDITSNFIVSDAGNVTITGGNNFLMGRESGNSMAGGSNNVGIGYRTLYSATQNTYNFALGTLSLNALTGTKTANIAIGHNALRNCTDSYNVAIGYTAGQNITSGQRNVMIGTSAGKNSGTADYCVLIGMNAGADNTTSNRLYITTTNTTTPLIYGEFNTGILKFHTEDSGTNSIVNTVTLNHLTDVTAAAGFGTGLLAELQSSTTAGQSAGRLTYEWATATHATRKALGKLTVYDTAEREAIRWEASGSAAMLGFYGATATAKQAITGSRGGNAALADLLTKLAAIGLITDSTT